MNSRREWCELDTKTIFRKLRSSERGLDDKEARTRIRKVGFNELKERTKISRLRIFLRQFSSILVIILIFATLFSFLIGETLDASVILIVVFINAFVGYTQEYKAEKTIEALKKLTVHESIVLRDGRERKIPSRELVPGDIVFLGQGRRVPADIRLIEETELKIDESALTGESAPVKKQTGTCKKAVLAERKNLAYMGTVVTYGRAKGMVVETGMKTEIGKIAHAVQIAGEEPTPLQVKLNVFGKKLGLIIIGISVIVIISGILRGNPLLDMIITGIALAVAAIPEGLPAVVTITLTFGLWRLSKRNAIINKLPAAEALGSVTVICADKTGTLTKNEMTVRKIWHNGKTIEVTGQGFRPEGRFLFNGKKIAPKQDKNLEMILKTAMLCNNAKLYEEDNRWKIIGDPTEGALSVAARKAGIILHNPRTREIPFTSERKMMTTINREKSSLIVHSKGAPEVILSRCNRVYFHGRLKPLTETEKRKILEANQKLGSHALRVLALAYKEFKNEKPEENLVFLGLMGMIDPPRGSVKNDIALCNRAGIKVVMITGDHKETAVAIARELALPVKRALTGSELDSMPDRELENVAEEISVYARVNPEHKVRIVDALKKKGHIISMTGDGVNDAPALKKADVGVAMGIKGTDVAKEASDMVLADDNFSTIVTAVRAGRQIYDNIRKFIYYLLSSNMGEVLTVFIGMLIGLPLPVIAVQLLWINLVTDLFPALALGSEPEESDIMERKPRDPEEKILSGSALKFISMVGAIMCIGTLSIFYYALPLGYTYALTLSFTTLVLFQMFNVVNCRSLKRNFWKPGVFSNRKLIYAMLSSVILQFAVIYVPFMQLAFRTVAIGPFEWLAIILVSSMVLIITQLKIRISGGYY